MRVLRVSIVRFGRSAAVQSSNREIALSQDSPCPCFLSSLHSMEQNIPQGPSSYTTISEILNTELQKKVHLDLTGKVNNISNRYVANGGSSEVFQGDLETEDGAAVQCVAIKQVRAELQGAESFAKVSFVSVFGEFASETIFKAVCKRDMYCVKARPYQYNETRGLHYDRKLSLCCNTMGRRRDSQCLHK